MSVISSHFLQNILKVHSNLQNKVVYPFFDPACVRYEAIRNVNVDGASVKSAKQKYGLTEHEYRKALSEFGKYGVAGLIGIDSKQITEECSLEIERKIYVLKKARPQIPASKMVTIIEGFNHIVPVPLMRRIYASYGWSSLAKTYKKVNFETLNLKASMLRQIKESEVLRSSFFSEEDRLQSLLEVFRTLDKRGITKRYPGSRVSFKAHKDKFLSIGLLGLIDSARPPFRNSKIGFVEEGNLILSKIQKPKLDNKHFLKILKSKKISVNPVCLIKIFEKWEVDEFQSQFRGEIERLSNDETTDVLPQEIFPQASPVGLDESFITFITRLKEQPVANPGIFLFLPYLNRLKIFEKAESLMDLDPEKGYSWFNMLLLYLGRILEGISSTRKACNTHELSLPLFAGLVSMPCEDTILNKTASISESELFQLRQYLTQVSGREALIRNRRIAFDFHMREFTGDDVQLKNIGKGPSPKRKLCFAGFRPHIAWDIDTGTPISIEFRNGKARATTTVKRFINELLIQPLGKDSIEHVYVDSEYTAEHVWQYVTDDKDGLGADLTMCIKQNSKVKKYINAFLATNPTWLQYDENHTYTEQSFSIPIKNTNKILQCVLKRKEKNGKLRCFGTTLKNLDSRGIMKEYSLRWKIENGIKDLIENYFLNNNPGIDPHNINVHYFIVTLARILFEMFSLDYDGSLNPDMSKKGLGTIRQEFIVGTNAVLSRKKDTLVLTWQDFYPEKKHKIIKKFFNKLNKEAQQGLPFLGGLKLKFEIVPPRSESLQNQLRRKKINL